MTGPGVGAELAAGQTDREPGFIFQRVARLRIKLMDKWLAPHGLTSSQVFLLNALMLEDGMSQTELARRLSIGTVAVSAMVDRLQAAGLVRRGEDPNDRRANRVWLQDAAKTERARLVRILGSVNDATFAGLSGEEIDTLLTLLDKVRGNLAAELASDRPADTDG